MRLRGISNKYLKEEFVKKYNSNFSIDDEFKDVHRSSKP